MLILDVEQGTEEWFAARAGIPTASMFKKIITSTGKPSKSASDYAYQLAGERLSGKIENIYSNAYMERGVELEPVAREMYEFVCGGDIKTVGLCYRDEKKEFSCSPDALVGDNGGLEIKCPSIGVHMKYLHGDKLPTEYFQQVQGCLFVTGRSWWDFVSFYPDVRPFVKRCYPDTDFHRLLEAEIHKINVKIEKIINETA